MSVYEKFQTVATKYLLPLAEKFAVNKAIQSISTGIMYTLPLTLVASLFSILGNFPIPSVNTWLESTGLSLQFNALLGGTLNIISLLIAFSIPYSYTKLLKKSNESPLIAGFFTVASYVTLMPQTIVSGGMSLEALDYKYLGSSGMFAAIFLGLVISRAYIYLSENKKLIIKMPKDVPPMVAQSFEPLIVGLIILSFVVSIRILLSYTQFENLFSLIQIIIGDPITKVGSSVPALIGVTVLANGLFFFGIHPNAINSALMPILMNMAIENVTAYQQGTSLPFKDIMIVNSFLNNDAVGSTLSLLIAIFIFGKSKRYRSFAKVSVIPNIFNINEPVIFGLPVMLNPILLIPFLLSTIITAMIGYIGSVTGFIVHYDPVISLGISSLWTIPKFISTSFFMGWQGLLLRIISMITMILVYMPFVKIMDKKETCNEEMIN